MYIHQNIYNYKGDLSVDAFKKKQQKIINAQSKLLNAEKKNFEQLLKQNKNLEQEYIKFKEDIQQTAEQVTLYLQQISFKGLIGKKNYSAELIQQKLNKESDKMEEWVNVLQSIIDDYKNQPNLYSGIDIKQLSDKQEKIKFIIRQMRQGEITKEALGEIIGFASDMIGKISEDFTTYLMLQKGIKARSTGTIAGEHFKTITSDIRATFNLLIPEIGISQKRTTHTTKKSVNIKSKTAVLSSLLSAIGASRSIISPLYQIIANAGRSMYKFDASQGQGQPLITEYYNTDTLTAITPMLHNMFLLTSLSGELNSQKDFAKFLIVNDKVFNIYDLILDFFNTADKQSNINIQSNFLNAQKTIAAKHTELVNQTLTGNLSSKQRSALILKQIQSMNLIIRARISLTK